MAATGCVPGAHVAPGSRQCAAFSKYPAAAVPGLGLRAVGPRRPREAVVGAAAALEPPAVAHEEMHPTTYELLTDRDWSSEFAEYTRATQQLQELAALQAELMDSVATIDNLLLMPQLPSLQPDAEFALDPEAVERRRAKRQQAREARKGGSRGPVPPTDPTSQPVQMPEAVEVQAVAVEVQAPPIIAASHVAPAAAAAPAPSQPVHSVVAVAAARPRATRRRRSTTPVTIITPAASAPPMVSSVTSSSTLSLAPSLGLQSAIISSARHQSSELSLSAPLVTSEAGAASPAAVRGRVRAARNASPRRSVTPGAVAGARTPTASSSGTADGTSQFMKGMSGVALLTPEQQKEVALVVKDFLTVKALETELTALLKRRPTLDELARATNMDPHDLAARLRRGQDAKTHMVKANYRLVVAVVKRFQGRGLTLQDLITEGMQGLLKGVEKFEVDKGFRFSTYAHWWIRQSVTRALQEQSRAVRLPTHVQDLLARIRSMRSDLTAALGRAPSMEELAAELDLPASKVAETLASANQAASLEARVQGEDDNAAEMKDMIADDRATPDEVFEGDSIQSAMESVLRDLSAREADVLRMHWGLDGRPEMTLEEIGAHFNVTRERVRQIEMRAMQRLKARQRDLAATIMGELEDVATTDVSATARASRSLRKS